MSCKVNINNVVFFGDEHVYLHRGEVFGLPISDVTSFGRWREIVAIMAEDRGVEPSVAIRAVELGIEHRDNENLEYGGGADGELLDGFVSPFFGLGEISFETFLVVAKIADRMHHAYRCPKKRK